MKRPRADGAAVALALLAAATPLAVTGAEGSTLVPPPRAHTLGIHRVTTRELAVFLPHITLDEPAGIAVTRLASTDDPETSNDNDEVTLVALDRSSGSVLTNFGLFRAGSWDGSEDADGRLSRPTDVAIDRHGTVGVTDTGNRRVVVLHHDGSRLTRTGVFPGFLEPTGIAADGQGGFFVCDRRFQTVFHLDPATGERTTFGLEVAFERPVDVATVPAGDVMARGKRRVLVVADQDGGRIRVFDPVGSLKASRTAASLAVPDASFDAIDVDYYGNVFAVDRRGDRIHKFRDDLYPLDTFGGREEEPEFRAPRGIAIHRRLGQVFVSEEAGGTYLWIGTDLVGLEVTGEDRRVGFRYVITEDSKVSVRVLDPQGRTVAVLVEGSYQAAGPQQGQWDGSDATGARLPAGDYLLELRARATYASRSSFEARRLRSFTLERGGNR